MPGEGIKNDKDTKTDHTKICIMTAVRTAKTSVAAIPGVFADLSTDLPVFFFFSFFADIFTFPLFDYFVAFCTVSAIYDGSKRPNVTKK